MSDYTIGVFDSGLGGLTAMEALSELCPNRDIVYFGDTGHMPYGGRSREQLLYMARKNVEFMESLGCKLILAACGTVTSVALDTVAKETATPLFGVAEPAIAKAKELTRNNRIGFIATQACIDSGFNQALLKKAIPEAEILDRACPKFVPLIEQGICSLRDERLYEAIDEYLRDIKAAGADCLILGCTHYPIIAKAIGEYMGEGVNLISSGGEAAAALAGMISSSDSSRPGKRTYYTSGDAETFRCTAEQLLGKSLSGPVIGIEPYELI